MRLRFKFQKLGRLKYIGHLDLLNVFNRAVKSAKLPVSYSQGFNPHMLISFATPLPLGVTSVCEYVDIDFVDDWGERQDGFSFDALSQNTGCPQTADIAARLNARLPNDLSVTDITVLTPPYKRIASTVTAAAYEFTSSTIAENLSNDDISRFMAENTINVMKKTKTKNELTNIRPDILACTVNDGKLTASLSCGSAKNLKPRLFVDALAEYFRLDLPSYTVAIERVDIIL